MKTPVIEPRGRWHARCPRYPAVALLVCAAALAGCSAVQPPPLPATCADVTSIFLVEDMLAATDHACHDWVATTHGRVARSSSASAVVWSTRSDAGPALLVSAVHTLGVGYLDPASGDVPEALVDPAGQLGVPRIFLVEPDGAAISAEASPLFHLYHPAIPDDENTNGFRELLPVHDFYFGVIDDQQIEVSGIVGLAEPVHAAGPALHDPLERADSAPTFSAVEPGDHVLLAGFPAAAPYAGRQSASVGRVLSDAEATAAIAMLADAGDMEGDIAYQPEVEMIIAGAAAGGMSGGGVFDAQSRVVGIIVRASDPLDGVQYVRAVRMTYAVEQLTEAFGGLTADTQAAIAPYLEPEVSE